jgi:tetratricopeptide (TPR) repeat protein
VSEHDQRPVQGPEDPIDQPEDHLSGLGSTFLSGVEHFRQGRIDKATEAFRAILAVEPRLAEPRLELARILLDTGRLPEAEAEAREALRLLEAGAQWLEALDESVMLGLAHGLLAEILRQLADTDEVIFGEPERFHAITRQAREHFAKAATLDPENQHAAYHAFFMKLEIPDGGFATEVPQQQQGPEQDG